MECTRRLTFSAGHRVMGHEGKCAHPHGHNYVVEITAAGLCDPLGRVIDFGIVKERVGGWIDQKWDHAFLVNEADEELINALDGHGWRISFLKQNPTAEFLAAVLADLSRCLLPEVKVTRVRVHETENCWADAVPGE